MAKKRIQEGASHLEATRKKLRSEGLGNAEIKRALDPMRTFQMQFIEEVEIYENLKQGKFPTLQNLGGLGPLLISLRISLGLSQRELAERLGVHETQVSRDERNDYHGVTVSRAGKVLEAMNARLTSRIEPKVSSNSR
nr:helix-turn-helix transcriptional regulator [Candidatus Krumholzibacteria bacterium]